MMTCFGCKSTPAPIATQPIDTFCELKYNRLVLTKEDYNLIIELRTTKYLRTIDKYIKYQALNEKEYYQCEKK